MIFEDSKKEVKFCSELPERRERHGTKDLGKWKCAANCKVGLSGDVRHSSMMSLRDT